jgi:outer membrane protein assembly factor BamB
MKWLWYLLLVPCSVMAANWPAWRGSSGSGVADESAFPTKWSATENVRWKMALPEPGNSTPVVWGKHIFITQPLAKEKKRTLMCLDRKNGKLLWQKSVRWDAEEETHETNPYCSSTPVTDGERVIVWYGSAGVHCYDFEGNEIWKRDLPKIDHEWGYGSSPLIEGDLCILYHGPGKEGRLIAVNKKTGKTVWEVEDPRIQKRARTDGFRGQDGKGIVGSFASPIIAKGELIMIYPQLVCAFDPKTGKELWRCDGLNELIYTSPIAGEGVVVAMGGFLGTTIAVKQGGKGDVTDSHRLWQSVRTKNRLGSGVIKDGHVYILNTESIAECIDLKTGKSLWQERVSAVGPKSSSWSSMVLAGDKIYILNQSGDTVIMKADPKFEIVAVNAVGNELTNSSHALSDGEIFIRTHENLWCIGETRAASR